MAGVIQFDVQKTLKQIPLEGVTDIVMVCLFEDDKIKTYTTAKSDDYAADLLCDALALYEAKLEKLEAEAIKGAKG